MLDATVICALLVPAVHRRFDTVLLALLSIWG
jgi:hypothetical protein